MPKYGSAAMKNVFWKDLAAPCSDRFLGLSSFSVTGCPRLLLLLWVPECVLFYLVWKASIWFLHGCWGFLKSGHLFEMFSPSERQACTAVICMHIHTGQKCGKKISLSQHSLLKTYHQHRVGIAIRKKRVSSDVFCAMRRYTEGVH